jgi:hypothetical protein
MTRIAFVLLVGLAACSGSPMVCEGTPATGPIDEERDPQTGTCSVAVDGCGCDPCAGACDPCANGQAAELPSCTGPCEGLGESACLATAGCHAAYLQAQGGSAVPFWGCWDIAPLTPQESSSCSSLDALACMQQDNCTSTYVSYDGPAPDPSFSTCNAETTPPPPAACSTLTTAAACTARTDCEPIYDGSDCTCTPNGCTCQVETFELCQPN